MAEIAQAIKEKSDWVVFASDGICVAHNLPEHEARSRAHDFAAANGREFTARRQATR
jgi:hypothetical protein